MGLSKKMESQIHGHPIVAHNFRPHSRKLGYPPFLDKAMWVKNLRLMEPHGICGRKGVGNFECVEKNIEKTVYLEYERMMKNEE